MKAARFTNVVEKAGEPEPHLVLLEPKKDRELQAAIKANRVMTVFQESVGSKADRGEVGFDPGINRQFLIFPKSLRSFVGKEIVGIKYDLTKLKEIPKSQRAVVSRKPAAKKQKPPKHEEKALAAPLSVEDEQPVLKQDERIAAIKRKVQHAMKILEDGKAVAAFNLLKEIVEGE